MSEPAMGPCDVCVLVHDDSMPKPVRFCSLCQAWLCDSCRGRYDLRTVAAVKRHGARMLEALGMR